MKLAAVAVLLCTMAMAQSSNSTETPKADVIFRNANIYTGLKDRSTFGETQRRAEALAIRGDRVVAIGGNSEIIKWKGTQTQVIDLHGQLVMPGFNDAHVHLAEAGFQKLSVNLVGVRSLDEFRQRIRERVMSAAPGEWITGGGWDETLWPVKTPPSRWDVDEVSQGHPVFLQRVDGHIAVANTKALQLASVTVASRDPEGGKIDRDESGTPSGILRETARDAVFAIIPKATHEKRRQGIMQALADAARWGITSAQDNSSWEDFQVYEELEREGQLTLRISEWLPFDASVDGLKAMRDSHPRSDNMLHTGMLKGFMDGSLGSHTAALLQPYADDPRNSGLPRYDAEKLNEMTEERLAEGFQIGFHAIGDRGVQMALDAFAGAEEAVREQAPKSPNANNDFRLRIEHAQVTTPAEIQKFKSLKVIASMQPNHLLTDMNWAQNRLGPERAAHSYAWAEFLSKGVALAFGTDYPVEPITPFRGLYAAVTRQSEDGKKRYYPEQRLTIDQAIAAYTIGSAYAEFAEKEKGSLQPGMLADFVVLDRDITSIPAEKILETKVLRTVVGGKTVYEAK
ncbi:MAG: amidohydrolase [Acidobacteriota bacterium]